MISPFKFLDAYTLQDRAVFFGREKEEEQLYEMVFETPLLLIYGLSGTGKTSLIQCGLASRFDGPDWYPFFIRRNQDINASLQEALTKAAKGKWRGELKTTIKWMFRYYLRPIYLIFDQFEELFIMGGVEEQELFTKNIAELIDAGIPCKIILVMREEYIGRLYKMEKSIPILFDFRLRVEPMTNETIKEEVLLKSFEKFNVSLEVPKEERLEQMISSISDENIVIQLPYLQVYLDMLWQEDFARTYPDGWSGEGLPPLQFTKQEIKEFGEIEDVLERFLMRQTQLLQAEMEQTYPSFPDDGVRKILDAFVTEEATKRPVHYHLVEGELSIADASSAAFNKIRHRESMSTIIQRLEKARLLRFSERIIELAHDSLGVLIDNLRTAEERQLNDILKRLSSAYIEKERTGEYLSEKQLNSMEEYFPKLQMEPHIRTFVISSRKKLEQAKKNRKSWLKKNNSVKRLK